MTRFELFVFDACVFGGWAMCLLFVYLEVTQ
ncbi:hypothetical protein [Pseudomonas phage 22PfluR64PP]|uniref:Uncharacterized protein n=1 Tax=Pseudomonas phage 22PfluR64PP TaxID=2163970 RepID=A0A3G6V4C1_9CAUD|nr:hypothetical protein HOT19_gp03 [Pseudomonas phage 22PfluR64PP]AZB48857.1 hypothetical protein [Pseudomonas phage 22PfluR64PP]